MGTTDRLIAICSWVAESWIASGMPEAKIFVVPNGIDPGHYYRRDPAERARVRNQLGIGENEQLLLWVGRLDRKTKGLDRLVAVASRLSNDTRLVIVGDGPDREWLNATLASMNGRCVTKMLGRIDDPGDLFGSADSYLFTSVIEPFGLVLLEAISSSLAIYAFKCVGGGMNLLEELGACVFRDDKIAELVKAISERENVCCEELVRRTREYYSWPSIARRTEQIYLECVGGEIDLS